MGYRKNWDEKTYVPFKKVIDRALMLNVGEKLTFEAKPLSAKMAEQRVREYLRFMNEKDSTVDYVRMFIVRPLAGIDRVEIERRYPIEGVNVEILES